MATEKFFVFNEDGALKRLKGRIVRFLDNEDPTGSDKSAIRTSLEVSPDAEGLVQADVGTGPQNLVLHQHLGTLAYADAESVSMAKAEIESTTGTATTQALTVTDGSSTKFVVQEDGRVGIGNASPDAGYSGAADDLIVGDGVGDRGLTIVSGTTGNSYILFADGTGYGGYRGRVQYNHNADQLYLGASANTNWKIDGATGNFVRVTAGAGIDFGSTNTNTGVTVTGSVMSEYEVGTWTPAYSTSGSGFTNPPTMDVLSARYVRVGDLVSFSAAIRTDTVDLTGAGTYLLVTGLPYAASAASGNNHSAINVGSSVNWTNNPAGGYIPTGQSFIYLTKRTTSITGNLLEMSPSDLVAGSNTAYNQIMISGSYVIA